MKTQPLVIADKVFESRLFVGTGKYGSGQQMQSSLRASGTELVTMAMRRVQANGQADGIMEYLERDRYAFLPNTSGVRDAKEAIFAAELAREALATNWLKLEIHPDPKYLMPDPIETLKAAGYRTIAFTNSSIRLVTSQIANSGLLGLFDQQISVESTGTFKPDIKVYQHAAKQVGRPIETLRLIATHDWDTHGALSSGMRAGYIDRTGAPYHAQYLRPDAFADSMPELVAQILRLDETTA